MLINYYSTVKHNQQHDVPDYSAD